MVLIRFAVLLTAALILVSWGAYLFTRDPRYRQFAWQVVRFAGFALLVFGALYLLERFGLVAWRVLL
ncbi:MAG: hypothetical protein Fur0040_01100 [Sideroxydans sp.]